jgi:hypothetical protein
MEVQGGEAEVEVWVEMGVMEVQEVQVVGVEVQDQVERHLVVKVVMVVLEEVVVVVALIILMVAMEVLVY